MSIFISCCCCWYCCCCCCCCFCCCSSTWLICNDAVIWTCSTSRINPTLLYLAWQSSSSAPFPQSRSPSQIYESGIHLAGLSHLKCPAVQFHAEQSISSSELSLHVIFPSQTFSELIHLSSLHFHWPILQTQVEHSSDDSSDPSVQWNNPSQT